MVDQLNSLFFEGTQKYVAQKYWQTIILVVKMKMKAEGQQVQNKLFMS